MTDLESKAFSSNPFVAAGAQIDLLRKETLNLFDYFLWVKNLFSIKDPLKVYFDENFHIPKNIDFWFSTVLWACFYLNKNPTSHIKWLNGADTVYAVVRRKKQNQVDFFPDKWIYSTAHADDNLIVIPYKGIDFYLKEKDYSSLDFNEKLFREKIQKQEDDLKQLKESLSPIFIEKAPEDIVNKKKDQIVDLEQSLQEMKKILSATEAFNRMKPYL